MHIWIYGVRHVGQVGKPKKGDPPIRGTAESLRNMRSVALLLVLYKLSIKRMPRV
jgi:hypothetical protein